MKMHCLMQINLFSFLKSAAWPCLYNYYIYKNMFTLIVSFVEGYCIEKYCSEILLCEEKRKTAFFEFQFLWGLPLWTYKPAEKKQKLARTVLPCLMILQHKCYHYATYSTPCFIAGRFYKCNQKFHPRPNPVNWPSTEWNGQCITSN